MGDVHGKVMDKDRCQLVQYVLPDTVKDAVHQLVLVFIMTVKGVP